MSDSSGADCFAEAPYESTHSTKVKKRKIPSGADSVNAEAPYENTHSTTVKKRKISSEADSVNAEAPYENTHSTTAKKRKISSEADCFAEASCENTDNIKGADLCG